VIRQLQKSYSDENIVFVREPYMKTVPPAPLATIDPDKDSYIIVMINANNEIRIEGKWRPEEGITASFNTKENIKPLELDKLDGYITSAIPEIRERGASESKIVKGLKADVKCDYTCSNRVRIEVQRILEKYVEPVYISHRSPEVTAP
jgi:hypothetical protein